VKNILLLTAALVSVSAAPATKTFTGVITDDMCAKAGHASMRMGPTDADCTRACVDVHGASFVIYDGKTMYRLSDTKKADTFAGQKVKVVGALDQKTNTIQVQSIAAVR
jgi:hypothetical protein